MDIYKLGHEWLENNRRRFFCAHMDEDEIALAAFCAGYTSAQQLPETDDGDSAGQPKLSTPEGDPTPQGDLNPPAAA